MFIQHYSLDELQFAYCCRVYLRWLTYKGKPNSALNELSQSAIEKIGERYGIHILESDANDTEVRLLASLKPQETVSACASKLKGQISKWIRGKLKLSVPKHLISRGYFACTTGKNTATAVNRYLDQQGKHHGYDKRPRPPVFLRTYEISSQDEQRLRPKHAVTHLQHHVVMATSYRQGAFGSEAARAVSENWVTSLRGKQAAMLKVSFVPDHVHMALRLHPSVSPAELIVDLMNLGQEFMWEHFEEAVVRAGIERLWQPSAYLGSFGDLESTKISKYIQQWRERESE